MKSFRAYIQYHTENLSVFSNILADPYLVIKAIVFDPFQYRKSHHNDKPFMYQMPKLDIQRYYLFLMQMISLE